MCAECHAGEGPASWIRELAWRDFLADLLFDNPHMLTQPLDPRWEALRWSRSALRLDAWREGRTGVPAVDAAMRQLEATGWIANRARMIAAQFLSKQLRVHWRHGEKVFKDWLLDGDTASNVGNWQWAAGTGVDNAPYFRVFDPVAQARRHDPEGAWITRWVPECGGDPRPREDAVVDLKQARAEYLAEAERV
jgi:deoxyribodipyrimidine photo-lyase